MEQAFDYFRNEIKIGDTVAFMQIGYRCLMTGVVKSISRTELRISHEPTNVGQTQTKQSHNQVIVKK